MARIDATDVRHIEISLWERNDGKPISIQAGAYNGANTTKETFRSVEDVLEHVERLVRRMFEIREQQLTEQRDRLIDELAATQRQLAS
jgi:hypothetical protein